MKWVALFLLLLLAACAGPNAPNPPKPPAAHVSRLDITPAGVLLTTAAPSQTLSVQALDQNGQAVKAAVTWTSSKPGVVSVSADGKVTAHGDLGSARITAQAGSVKASIIAIVAQPVAGAVLVTDEQIVGDPQPLAVGAQSVAGQPQPADDGTQFGVGFRYTVELKGVTPPPSIGAILLTTGEKPVAGKVVAVDGNTVTLEVVPINEVFPKLDINESFDLSEAPFTTPQAIAQNFETTRLPDGRIRLQLKEGRTLSSGLQPQAKFHAGPFECETEFSVVQVDLPKADVTFNTDLHYDIIWNDSQKKMVIRGKPTATVQLTAVLAASVNGKVTCKETLHEYKIPLPGPVGAFLGGQVPTGVGFELEGKLPIAGFGEQVQGVVGVNFAMGFDCHPDCKPVHSLENASDGDITSVRPKLSGLKVEASLYGFLFADFEAGAHIEKKFRIEAFEATAGLKEEVKLASEETQAADPNYKSSYNLNFEGVIGAGPKIEQFIEFLQITLPKLELKRVITLGASPTGSVSADKASFKADDTVTFKVKLNPDTVNIPFVGYNIESVRVYRRAGNPAAPDPNKLEFVQEVTASDGQTDFELPWVATVDGEVTGNFVAFVKTKSLPVLRLELGDAAPPGPSITISPTSVTLAPLETQQFTATVTVLTDTSVDWTATGGAVTNTGLFTAPSAPGSYQVTATSIADPSLKASATVTVVSGDATLTFTAIYTTDAAFGGPVEDYTGHSNTVEKASYQLRKVSETDGEISFEIIGGSASVIEKVNEHAVYHNVDKYGDGTCIYNETTDYARSISGSGPPQEHEAPVLVDIFGSDSTYLISTDWHKVPSSGTDTYTERYEYLKGGPCETDVTKHNQFSGTSNVGLTGFYLLPHGTVDPNNPKVLSGSDTETALDMNGTRTVTTTTTWKLVLP